MWATRRGSRNAYLQEREYLTDGAAVSEDKTGAKFVRRRARSRAIDFVSMQPRSFLDAKQNATSKGVLADPPRTIDAFMTFTRQPPPIV